MVVSQHALVQLNALTKASLDAFQLSRLVSVANLQKQLHQTLRRWTEVIIETKLARWVGGRRRNERRAVLGSIGALARKIPCCLAVCSPLHLADASMLLLPPKRLLIRNLSIEVAAAVCRLTRRIFRKSSPTIHRAVPQQSCVHVTFSPALFTLAAVVLCISSRF